MRLSEKEHQARDRVLKDKIDLTERFCDGLVAQDARFMTDVQERTKTVSEAIDGWIDLSNDQGRMCASYRERHRKPALPVMLPIVRKSRTRVP